MGRVDRSNVPLDDDIDEPFARDLAFVDILGCSESVLGWYACESLSCSLSGSTLRYRWLGRCRCSSLCGTFRLGLTDCGFSHCLCTVAHHLLCALESSGDNVRQRMSTWVLVHLRRREVEWLHISRRPVTKLTVLIPDRPLIVVTESRSHLVGASELKVRICVAKGFC